MQSEKQDSNENIKETKIYRFKFSEHINELLLEFSKLHQFEDRKLYKESWKLFLENNKEVLEREIIRIQDLGYSGDCYDKMYKSSRYYFRKKSTIKSQPKDRRKYVATNREILDTMDEHIEIEIKNTNFKPSDGYDSYISNNKELIKKEIIRMKENGLNDPTIISQKLKKAYKNRYFLFINAK